ncbi:MAG: hypothetical protein HY295_03055 [Thaumarchaeota archaeon]|nr:hypothetical protein [Nitrososphaerota archaeon]
MSKQVVKIAWYSPLNAYVSVRTLFGDQLGKCSSNLICKSPLLHPMWWQKKSQTISYVFFMPARPKFPM